MRNKCRTGLDFSVLIRYTVMRNLHWICKKRLVLGHRKLSAPVIAFPIYHPFREGEHMKLMQWIWAIVIGFVVGLIARAVLPGADQMGLLGTTIVGILGSFVGGFIGNLIKKPAEGAKFTPAGFLMSIVGAVVLLVIWRMIQ